MLQEPSPFLMEWMAAQSDVSLFTSAISIAEIRRGILILPQGRKRFDLEAWFFGPAGPLKPFQGRILAFDENAAFIWAEMMSKGRQEGRSRSAFDTMIAAIAQVNGCIVVTDNTKDFTDVETINPVRTKLI
jgi:toxin FitB